MNVEGKKSCEFICTNMWVRILVVREMGYVVYRMTRIHSQNRPRLPVVVLLWYIKDHKISLHREGTIPQIITSVDLKEETAHVKCMLYPLHSICSLEVVCLSGETTSDHSSMWGLPPHHALRFIINCIARDITVEAGDYAEDGPLSLFSTLPMILAERNGPHEGQKTPLAFCTHYDGYQGQTYVHAGENSNQLVSVDEGVTASKSTRPQVLDVYSGICMPGYNAPMLKIFTKETNGMGDGRYVWTKNVRTLIMETTGDFFSRACALTPFCRVEEPIDCDGGHTRLTLCLASKPSDDHIDLRLTLHKFLKATISRSLNACIEAQFLDENSELPQNFSAIGIE